MLKRVNLILFLFIFFFESHLILKWLWIDTIAEPGGYYGDEDLRSFYEDLINLKEMVPSIVFAEVDKENIKKDVKDVKEDKEDKETVKKEKQTKEDEEKEKEKEVEAFDKLTKNLPNCVNRDMIDKAAVEFCFINSKVHRRKLVKFVFGVQRNQLALLPYYSRLIATLNGSLFVFVCSFILVVSMLLHFWFLVAILFLLMLFIFIFNFNFCFNFNFIFYFLFFIF